MLVRKASDVVLEDAPLDCVHASSCPGCPWMSRPMHVQLRDKGARVERAVSGFEELAAAPVAETAEAERIEGYRVRAKLVADRDAKLGLFARGTHDVVDLPHCRVLDPLVAEAANAIRSCLATWPVLDGVDIARVGDALLVTLIASTGAAEQEVAALAKRVEECCPHLASLAVSKRSQGAVQLLGSGLRVVSGPDELQRRIHAEGPYHYATHGAFVQAHPDTAQRIYERIEQRVFASGVPRPRVLELHAGSGALSLALAKRGAEVVSVESFAPACERLERAAREQALSVEVRAQDAGSEALRRARAGERFDVVLVNPPRRGLDRDVRRALAELAPTELGYVSCHPATLARDLAHLAREGFATRTLEPFDMMPLTEHVESLAWLARAEVPLPTVLFEHERFVAVLKAPHEPTTPQGEHQSSLLARVQRLSGLSAATPVHRLDVGTSGVVLFARTPADVAPVAEALSRGEKRYLALAHGIVRPQGRIQRPIVEQGRTLEARTRYRREEVVAGHSLVRVALETGRKHQIRRHFAALGHPVVGDERYGDRRTNQHFVMRHGLDRPFLHCTSVSLELAGEHCEIRAPLAADLALVLDSMREDAHPKRHATTNRDGEPVRRVQLVER